MPKNLLSILNPFSSDTSKQGRHVHYSLKPNKRVYVIGDIHGCNHLLQPVLDKIISDSKQYLNQKELIIITLGDYVDRGPNSKHVIDLLLTHVPHYFHAIYLQGNHEVYMRAFIEKPQENTAWLEYGGRETLISYGVAPPETNDFENLNHVAGELLQKMPNSHFNFLHNLKEYFILDDYFFVHAGIDPDIPLDKQTVEALTSIRSKFINHKGHFQNKKIIHGHTPVEQVDIQPHRINLDTGAYLTGKLTAAIFENDTVELL